MAAQALIEGRVMRAQSGFYSVRTDAGEQYTAVLRGRQKKERRSEGLAALGDRVRIEALELPEGESGKVDAVLVEVLPRRSVLARRAPGPKGVWAQDVVVANVEQLLPVFSVRLPDPRLAMLDRFLALAEIDDIPSQIVFNKIDLGIPPALEREIETYEAIGYPVIRCSVVDGRGIDRLRSALSGKISAVVGPSGVGKSSLLNAAEPGLGLRVGEVSDALQKGRHTTRVGQLLPLAGGGWVADTPGLRELGLWSVDPGELEWAFVEFEPYLNACRFYDCSHMHEPGCAVREAVQAGDVSKRRYESYRRMLEGEER